MGLMLGGPDGAMAFEFQFDPEFKEALENMGDFNFDWAQAGPGIVIRPGDFDPEAIKAQIEMMQEQHRAHMDQMKKALAERGKALKLGAKPLELRKEALEQDQAASADQMRQLLDEIKQLREEIESLKKEKKN